ncbi:MAG: hypothetical protein KAR06_07110, partial [Deltaproteobacteria bacterium]|nr:hypothetical protein [Deltaproteobacteria bacterium]
LANGTYSITWPSDSVYKLWIAPTFDNCAEALWDLAAPINGLTIQVTQQLLDECTELVHTFGNAKLKAQNNITIPAVAALHTNGDWVEVYAAGSVRTITVDGTLDCRNLTIGRASSIASGGQLKGSGSVFVRGDFSLEASEASATVNNTLDLSSFQRFFVGGYFAIAGDRATILPSLTHLDLEVQGSVYGWAVSLFADFTNVTLLLIGSTFAELDYGDDIANDIHTHFTDITIRKELTGNVRAIWGQTYSGHYIGDAIGTTLMTWGAGQVFTFASMTHLHTDQYAITHVSDSAGVAANIVVGETGTQGNGANWLDISFNIPVYMNPGTCTDGGGNTNIFFSDIPIEGSSRNSLSLSLSLGF